MRYHRSTLGVLMFAMAACGGGSETPGGPAGPSGPSGSSGPSGPSTTNQIVVADNSFAPASTTITAGTAVTWTWNNTGDFHNVTFATGPNSDNKQTGTFQRSFTVVGTFLYSCTRHGGMNGTIIVQ